MEGIRLRAGAAEARLLRYGARLASLSLGGMPCLLAYPDDAANRDDDTWLGAALGRTSGRIADAALRLGGRTHRLSANEGADHLHGGSSGFGHVDWALEQEGESSATWRLESPDGDQGYPGRLDALCRVRLEEDALTLTYEAEADALTPVSLTHHPYFRLGGDVSAHRMSVNADAYLPLSPNGLPTGEVRSVRGTPLDLRGGGDLGAVLAALNAPLDHCLVCEDGVRVRLEGPAGALTITADQPCLQVYGAGKMGAPFWPGAGLALEPQAYPDAERCGFPARLLAPGDRWQRTTVIARA